MIKQERLMYFLCASFYSMCFPNNALLFLAIDLGVRYYLYLCFTTQENEAEKD